MRLRWYQSRLFWLGLVVLAFHLMVWIRYLRTDAYVAWSPEARSQYVFGWGRGTVGVNSHHWTGFMGIDGGYNDFEYDFSPVEEDWEVDVFAPAFIDLSYGLSRQEGKGWTVAHWVVFLIGGGAWIGAMTWNQRRKQKWLAGSPWKTGENP
jgi:hypothetical protein